MTKKIPVVVLTGYLGAGKTTLLNRILSEKQKQRFAVIVNEFGDIGIDNDLIIDTDEEIIEMNNGCICCNVRGDLLRILSVLLKRRDSFDAILIETTGLADPAPVAQTFFIDETIKEHLFLDAIVTVIDAENIFQQLEQGHEVAEQIAFADVLVVNKRDRVTPETFDNVKTRMRNLNPGAQLIPTERSLVAAEQLIGHGFFDLARILNVEPEFLQDVPHEHDESIFSFSLTSSQPLSETKFSQWMSQLLQDQGVDMLRTKGILHFGDGKRHAFQAVHMTAESEMIGFWPADEPATSRLVFIGRQLDRQQIEQGFLQTVA